MHYKNGSTAEIPVIFENNISGWWNPLPLPNAKIALETANLLHDPVGLYAMRWSNPHPENEISTIDILSSGNNLVPAVVAITGESGPSCQ